tara:strand:- start:6996 stop:7553 length:558 start_codon:yes stop_codon:yes gene_type:complete
MIKKIFLIAAFVCISLPSFAQFELGASYELRDSEPQSGFGVRIQSGILQSIPFVNLGIRAHFSYFSEENSIDSGGGFSYSEKLENYDFGLAAVGGVSVGLIEPYIGLGLGSENVDLKYKDFQGVGVNPDDDDESNIYWNTFIGAKVTIIPLLKPFVEYRFTSRDIEIPNMDDKTGRIMFGVVLSL